MEAAGDQVHIRVGDPVPIAARATIESLRDLHLTPGSRVTVRIEPGVAAVFDDPSPFLDDASNSTHEQRPTQRRASLFSR